MSAPDEDGATPALMTNPYTRPTAKGKDDGSYHPLLLSMALMPVMAIIAIPALLLLNGVIHVPGSGAPPAPSAIAAQAESTLTYPGAGGVHQTTEPLQASTGGVLAPLVNTLGASATGQVAITSALVPAGAPETNAWYNSYLTGHGWRSCHTIGQTGVTAQVYLRDTREAYLVATLDPSLFSHVFGTAATPGATPIATMYLIAGADLPATTCG